MKLNSFTLALAVLLYSLAFGQKKSTSTNRTNELKSSHLSGMKFRSVGPAFMSGRISDIAIHPSNENVWYVTVGSGGVWKTENAGTTWSAIFEKQTSYASGCVTLDPSNPEIVWVGTGENNGGRHIGFGDGIYRSEDGGSSWKNMGLKASEHISKIIVHPKNSNIVWVAAQGPLWSSGGDRGIFKTTDGGKTWEHVLSVDEWTGATDLLLDPRNPNVLYAATWQRQRTVAAYMGGGPGSGIHRSRDGGKTWEKLSNGLPSSNMGKIGLAMSPQQPDVLYAAIELDRRKGGVYRTSNQGGNWTKMSDAIAGGTGPHYYQELYACPHNFDRIYFADNYMQISNDGGKTFVRMNESTKHVDNHAVAFRKSDPNYLLVGTDGGLYESYDQTKTWNFIGNLPLTQFYKLALDDAAPFYNIFGGTQDNNTQGGPSRTDNVHGIRNSDWFVVLGGDGHQPATEPGNPNIVYAQWQQGNLMRHDRLTGENVYIQPQPDLGDPIERHNWDAPILVSPHNPTHLYFASQRVWKSTDRGDSWTPISKDLTKNIERLETPIFGKQQSWDNPWDVYAMSNYSTITSLAESPKKSGLIYVGTDDGLIQVTENGGQNWRKIDVGQLPGLPATAFVNDIKADLYDENTVYAVFDNHKYGDYAPYVYKSADKGKTWVSLVNNLPEKHLCWRIIQDHKEKNLLFLGTEFGVFYSNDRGKKWIQLKGGLPTIPVRDLAIQKRENDLVLATFGRGFYVLDDYSALRKVSSATLDKEAILYTPRKGYWYKQQRVLGGGKVASQGDNYFVADNPPFGVEFTYFLKEKYTTLEDKRKAAEKDKIKKNEEVPFPGWEALEKEKNQEKPVVWLYIMDMEGNIIQREKATNSKGIQRVSWDIRTISKGAITNSNVNRSYDGAMAAPGKYQGQLMKEIDGVFSAISEKVTFEVVPLRKGALEGVNPSKVAAFWKDVEEMYGKLTALNTTFGNAKERLALMMKAYERSPRMNPTLNQAMLDLHKKMIQLDYTLSGSKLRDEVGEKSPYPTIRDFIGAASTGTSGSTYGPTPTHQKSLSNAKKLMEDARVQVEQIRKVELPALEKQLEALGAPWIEGQDLK